MSDSNRRVVGINKTVLDAVNNLLEKRNQDAIVTMYLYEYFTTAGVLMAFLVGQETGVGIDELVTTFGFPKDVVDNLMERLERIQEQ